MVDVSLTFPSNLHEKAMLLLDTSMSEDEVICIADNRSFTCVKEKPASPFRHTFQRPRRKLGE